jgi:hypothetical protein
MQQVEVNLQNPGNMLRSNMTIFEQIITSPVFITKVGAQGPELLR